MGIGSVTKLLSAIDPSQMIAAFEQIRAEAEAMRTAQQFLLTEQAALRQDLASVARFLARRAELGDRNASEILARLGALELAFAGLRPCGSAISPQPKETENERPTIDTLAHFQRSN